MTAFDIHRLRSGVRAWARRARPLLAAAAGLLLTGCAGALGTGGLETGALESGAVPPTSPTTVKGSPEAGGAPTTAGSLASGLSSSLPKILPSVSLAPAQSPLVQASTAETYIRIARGANQCWFGGQGRLRASHVFYAEAESQLRSGATEIVIHERDVSSERPWGLKAYRISLSRSDERTVVAAENLKMAADEAQRMDAEVLRWAHGLMQCDAATDAAIAKAREAEAAALAASKPKAKRQAAAPKK